MKFKKSAYGFALSFIYIRIVIYIMGLMKFIKKYFCCGNNKDDVQKIYDELSQCEGVI
jgi:hypothetical protein